MRFGLAIGGLWLAVLAAGLGGHEVSAAGDGGLSSRLDPALSGAALPPAPPASASQTTDARHSIGARFDGEPASPDARHVANWIVDSGDSRGLPFVVVDKMEAKVFVFGADGGLRGAASALLGLARGDDAVPGIGDRPMSSIRPEERTTPAGRFVSALGRDARGADVLWVDYDTAIALHRVITTNPREHRAQRLASAIPLDRRISYGCINVPAAFFDHVVRPAFTGTNGIVYVLPETRSPRDVFASFNEDERVRRQ